MEKPYKRLRCLCAIYLKHCVTNGNHAIPSAMSGFITELLTLTVYCYFCNLCTDKDREAIQMSGLLLQRNVLNIFNTCYSHHIRLLFSTTNCNFCLPLEMLYFLHHTVQLNLNFTRVCITRVYLVTPVEHF